MKAETPGPGPLRLEQDRVPSAGNPKIHRSVYDQLPGSKSNGLIAAWVLFEPNKGLLSPQAKSAAIDAVAKTYSPEAIRRRTLRRTRPNLFDVDDVPVPTAYVDAIRQTGASVRVVSDWVNAVSVDATKAQFEEIARLDFVVKIQAVRRGPRLEPPADENSAGAMPISATAGSSFHGSSFPYLAQIAVTNLHALGFTGSGVRIGILDTGFLRTHETFNTPGHTLQVIAEYDFVRNDPNTAPQLGDPATQHQHGTNVLGLLAAYRPGFLVGAAYDAQFILCKTEDISAEYQAEEDYYAAGLQFHEAHGADVVTSSLGYIDWYTQADLDGMTAVTTIAVNTATANGVHCCNAAGNGGHDSNPTTSRLLAPADAYRVITVGAVDSTGTIAGFSSDGPTADGRVKPEVLADGVNDWTVSATSDTGYVQFSGTSAATPLIGGLVACLVQAHPDWTVDQMRWYLLHTAGDYVSFGQTDPTFVRGYGIANGAATVAEDCNNNSIADSQDISSGTSADCNHTLIPDECEIAAQPDLDQNHNSILDACEPPAVPAVSLAGLAVLAGLVLFAGSLLTHRRSQQQLANNTPS
ncbi:MAG: S8 family serine peptidase [Planctomycetes bacterium]|nr:S8 family serine peptidase [Planctomycetota bacterium]MBI3836063.1 S8 family serine peptidase [Planctomycetota bacterium]